MVRSSKYDSNSGKVVLESHYKNGNIDGTQRHYFANGKVDTEFTIARGRKNGVEKIFQANGACRTVFTTSRTTSFHGEQIDFNCRWEQKQSRAL